MRIRRSIALAALAVMGWSSVVHASLIGDTVNLQVYYLTKDAFFADVGDKVVGAGREYNLEAQETVDVTASQIILTFLSSGDFYNTAFNGLRFADLTHAFTSASLASSTVFGLDASDVSFAKGGIFLNEAGSVYAAGETIVLNVSAVPLPAAAPLFGAALLGLAGLGALSRRRRAPVAA